MTADKRLWWTKRRISERIRNDEFLEAALTAGFLVAASDGGVSADEYDALLDRFQLLADVDRDAIDEKLSVAANQLEASGFDPLLARVGDLIGDPAAGEAALMVALATALADHDVSAEERETATQIATAVGLPAADVDALLSELHG